MKKLTHAQRRDKQRAHTPAAKRRSARTSAMRALAKACGSRRTKTHPHSEAKPPVHKARVPGTVRKSRMPGGSGYRGDKLWEGTA